MSTSDAIFCLWFCFDDLSAQNLIHFLEQDGYGAIFAVTRAGRLAIAVQGDSY